MACDIRQCMWVDTGNDGTVGKHLVVPANHGTIEISCCVMDGVRGRTVHMGSYSAQIPAECNRCILIGDTNSGIDDKSGIFHPLKCIGESESIKLFLLFGGDRQLGIRTSQDWDHTYWGITCPSLPGYWIVACSDLRPGALEFKVVSTSDGTDWTIEWELHPFVNKRIMLDTHAQIISAKWNAKEACVLDVPVYIKEMEVSVAVPEEIHTIVGHSDSFSLIMISVKEQNGKLLFGKGHHVPLYFSDKTQTYVSRLTFFGNIEEVHFGLAIMNESGIITHVEERSFFKDKAERAWKVHYEHNRTIECGNFVDVRPINWHTNKEVSAMPSPLTSLVELLQTGRSPESSPTIQPQTPINNKYPTLPMDGSCPANMTASMYRDMMMAFSLCQDQTPSSQTKHRKRGSISDSVAKAFSFKGMKRRLSLKRRSVDEQTSAYD